MALAAIALIASLSLGMADTTFATQEHATIKKPEHKYVEVNAKKKYRKKHKRYKKVYRKKWVYSKKHKRYVRAYYVYKYSYSYRGGKGSGDCWTNSEILFKSLKNKGLKVRIIQYRTSMSSRHRSVQIYSNGQWTDYNYKANGYAMRYYATKSKPGCFVYKTG